MIYFPDDEIHEAARDRRARVVHSDRLFIVSRADGLAGL